MCKYADIIWLAILTGICTFNICTSAYHHCVSIKKALSLVQDGFYIFNKSTYRVLPAIASLIKSLATICSLNE
jgi:hypothetical protein